MKSTKADGAKDTRKVESVKTHEPKETRGEVPARATLPGESQPFGWVERAVWTDRMLESLRRGGPEGGKWYSLQDKVFKEKNLQAAYVRVARNKGAPGVDGMTVETFGERQVEEFTRLRNAWRTGMYRPQEIRRTWIPKPGTDERRPLGIPTVRDRVVQAAMVSVLEPIFDIEFSEHSHGFRPERSAQEAMAAVLGHLNAGKVFVVDADLKGYFDSIPHERLLAAVRRKVTDGRVLELIDMFLKAGIMEDGIITEPEAGTPQGGVVSPLLANIYLDGLDQLMAGLGVSMERYADDFVICCHTQEEADRALGQVQDWVAKAGLVLHPTKTRIVDLGKSGSYIDFLGFRLLRHVNRSGKSRLLRLVRPKSLVRIKDAIRARTHRKSGDSLEVQISRLNQTLRGWFAYFRSVGKTIHASLDRMVRTRLRAMLAKRIGRRLSHISEKACAKWTNAYFTAQGLFSLEEAHVCFIQPHRRAH